MPHLGNKQLGLLQAPSQDLADGEDDQPIERHIQGRTAVGTNLLEPLILGPRAYRGLVHPLVGIDEASRVNPLSHLIHQLECAPGHVARGVEELAPLLEDVVFVNRDFRVLGSELDVGLGVLEPAARLEGLEDLAVELGPVADGTVEGADVDEVERVGLKGPVELRVLNLETEVGGHPARLGWGDVDADNLGRGELVGHIASFFNVRTRLLQVECM